MQEADTRHKHSFIKPLNAWYLRWSMTVIRSKGKGAELLEEVMAFCQVKAISMGMHQSMSLSISVLHNEYNWVSL